MHAYNAVDGCQAEFSVPKNPSLRDRFHLEIEEQPPRAFLSQGSILVQRLPKGS